MLDTIDQDTDYNLPMGIVHADCPEDAEALADMIKLKTGFIHVIINDISPSIGSHSGPGALGVIYYGQPKQLPK